MSANLQKEITVQVTFEPSVVELTARCCSWCVLDSSCFFLMLPKAVCSNKYDLFHADAPQDGGLVCRWARFQENPYTTTCRTRCSVYIFFMILFLRVMLVVLFLYGELTGSSFGCWLSCKAFNWDVNVHGWRKGSLLCKTCIIIIFVGLRWISRQTFYLTDVYRFLFMVSWYKHVVQRCSYALSCLLMFSKCYF